MHHSQRIRHICPRVILTTGLTCSASSALMAVSPDGQDYFILGKVNGDVVFFAVGRYLFAKYDGPIESPITAITTGKLTWQNEEVITIASDGLLQSIGFPRTTQDGSLLPPILFFDQFLNANICAAKLVDIDGDGLNELLVVMTDRVVRTYKYTSGRLASLNKWELPSQIRGLSIGRSDNDQVYALLAQANQNYTIRIDFCATNCVTIPQTNVMNETDPTLDIPVDPIYVTIFTSLSKKLFIVDSDQKNKKELINLAGAIVCISCIVLENGIRLIFTVDTIGKLFIYGWLNDTVEFAYPILQCRVLPEVDHLSTVVSPLKAILMGVSTLRSKFAIYCIKLNSILNVIKEISN